MPSEPIGDLSIQITGDDSQLQQTINDAARLAQEGAQKIAGAFSSSFGGTGVLDLDASIKELGATTSQTATQFAAAGGPIAAFAEGITAVQVAAAAAVAGFAGIAAAVDGLVLSAGRAAESTGNLADRLNLSFEQTKTLSEMAQIAGISLGGLNMASMRLADSMEGDTAQAKRTAAALNELGVFAGNSGDLLVNFLEKLSQIPDATERISKAHEVLGRGAVQLEPLIKNYESLQEAVISLGGHIDGDLVKRLQDADDAADKLSIAWTHFKESLAATFAPAVMHGLEFLTSVLSQGGEPPLAKQIDILNDKIDQLRRQGSDPAFLKFLSMLGGAQMQGPGFTPDNTSLEALKAQRDALQGIKDAQDDAIKRSKDYNAELDKSNALNLQWTREAAERAKAQKAADAAASAELRAEQASTKEYIRLNNERLKTVEAVRKALEDTGVNVKVDPQLLKWQKDLETLRAAYFKLGKDSGTSLAQIAQAQENVNRQIEQLDVDRLETWARDAEILGEKLQKAFARENFAGPLSAGQQAIDLLHLSLGPIADDLARAGTAAMTLATADKILGIQMTETGELTTKQIQALNAELDSGSLERAELAWAKVSGTLAHLAKTDLPLAVTEYQKILATLRATGAPLGEQLAVQEAINNVLIQQRIERGQSATDLILENEQIRIQLKLLHDAATLVGQLAADLNHAFDSLFKNLSKGLTDAITGAKSIGEALRGVAEQFYHDLVQSIMDAVVKGFQDAFLQTGIQKTITEGVSKAVGAGLSAIGLAPKVAAGAPVTLPTGIGENLPNVDKLGKPSAPGVPTGGGGGAAGAASSALGTGLSIASLGVAVAAGITQGIQMASLLSDTGKIEVSTRASKEQLIHIQDTLNIYLPELKHLVDIWGAINDLTNILSAYARSIDPSGENTVVGHFVAAMDTLADLRSIPDPFAKTATSANSFAAAVTDSEAVVSTFTDSLVALDAATSSTVRTIGSLGGADEQVFSLVRQAFISGTGAYADLFKADPLALAMSQTGGDREAAAKALLEQIKAGQSPATLVDPTGLGTEYLTGQISLQEYQRRAAELTIQAMTEQIQANRSLSTGPIGQDLQTLIDQTFTTPVTRGEMTVGGAVTEAPDRFTADQIQTAADQYRAALQTAADALEQQRGASNSLIATYALGVAQAEARVGALLDKFDSPQQLADWLAAYNAKQPIHSAFGDITGTIYNRSQAEIDQTILRMGGLRTHAAPPIDVSGMTANYQSSLQNAAVTVYAVDPSSTQLTNSIIMGLQRNGIRTR